MTPRAADAEVAARTLGHYDANARSFWEGTRDHDVAQNIAALVDHLPGRPPWTILDFGCGPGRDLRTFREHGHRAIGLEGSPELAAMARAHSGCPVLEQNFLALALPAAHFDGIFANASLFHVPSRALPDVLRDLHAALKPQGVLFSSNPRGNDDEGWAGERYGVWHSLEGWRHYLRDAAFDEVLHYYRPPGLPRERQQWLAGVWRKRDAVGE